MAKKPKSPSPFEGRWHIVSMSEWDEDYINAEVQAFIEFDAKNGWTWEGNDENDPVQGRGWAVRKGDELHGMIFFHEGGDSEFVAKKATETKTTKWK